MTTKAFCFGLLCSLAFHSALPAQDDEQSPSLDNPGQAAVFRALLVRGTMNAEIPPNALPKAAAQIHALRQGVAARIGMQPQAMMLQAAQGIETTVGGVPVGPLLGQAIPENGNTDVVPHSIPFATATAINPAGWKWLGPGNVGGRTRSLLIHPTQPQTIWLGGVGGGVWKSTNGGLTWAPLYDLMANVAVSCMALDPNNPDCLFAGTGEGFYNADALRGFGIFISKNGGATWSQLPATANENFRYINRLAITSTGANSTTILAATQKGLFRSTDGGGTFASLGAPVSSEILDVRFHPTDSLRAVAGSRGGRAYYTKDGGVSWQTATGIGAVVGPNRGRVELCYSRANGDVVFASVDDGQGKVFRSTDGGQTYKPRSSPGHLGGQGWYANCLWAGDPTDPNVLVVGGLDLYRSTNGGTTFTKISQWQSAPASAHADHHVIVAHPTYNGTTNKTVFFGNDGGIYRADDISTVALTTGWHSLNNNLGITQFYAAAVHPPSGAIVAGAQDNGTVYFLPPGNSDSWKSVFGGDGGDSAFDPVVQTHYGEYVWLQIHRGQAGGASAYIFNGIRDAGNRATALFIAPFVLDSNNSSRMLAGGASLWRTNDVRTPTPVWAWIKSPATSGLISAIAVAPGNSNVVWVGTSTGIVEKTNNATAAMPNWTVVAGLPPRYCSRIAFNPLDPSLNTLYVTSTGYSAGNLQMTSDGGATWATLGVGVLPDIPFYDIVVHPANDQLLYLGTELGLFVSDDGGATWSPTNQGPTNAPVSRLFWVGERLYVATHGRGIFTIDLSTTSPPPAPAAADISP